MRQRLQRFMAGRYGADQLNKMLFGISMVFLLISIFSRLTIFYAIAIAVLAYAYFRMFSRNIGKRYEENQRFLNWRYGLAVKKDKWKKRQEQKKIYRFYRCPGCRQTVRVPKGKGKICITCPKCRMEFVKKS